LTETLHSEKTAPLTKREFKKRKEVRGVTGVGLRFSYLLWGFFVFASFVYPAVHAKPSRDNGMVERAILDPATWWQETLNSPHRPRLSDVVRVLENCEECRVLLERADGAPDKQYLATAPTVLPVIVARLEAAYPNGHYATLGRDSFGIADVLEAFYCALGVEGRVFRLGASSPTFGAFNQNFELARRFLQTNGFDVEKALTGEQPFAIIDRTGYSNGSQSTTLMRAIFDDPALSSEQKQQLGQWVAVVSTSSGTAIGNTSAEVEAQKAVSADLSSWPHGGIVPPHFSIAEMATLTDKSHVWHNGFVTPIIEREDGILTGTPSSLTPESSRVGALKEFWQLYQTMKTDEVQTAVFAAAERAGVDLKARLQAQASGRPLVVSNKTRRLTQLVEGDLRSVLGSRWDEASEEQAALRKKIVEARRMRWSDLASHADRRAGSAVANQFKVWRRGLKVYRDQTKCATQPGLLLREMAFDLSPLDLQNQPMDDFHKSGEGGKKMYYSANAEKLYQFLKKWNATETLDGKAIEDVLRVVEQAARMNVITPKDDRRLMLYALSNMANLDPFSVASLKKTIDELPTVRRILIEKAKVFLTSERFNEGRSRLVYMALVEAGALPYPAECASLLEGAEGE
jgi:hypothetical protein